jgi:hypothetical protein
MYFISNELFPLLEARGCNGVRGLQVTGDDVLVCQHLPDAQRVQDSFNGVRGQELCQSLKCTILYRGSLSVFLSSGKILPFRLKP